MEHIGGAENISFYWQSPPEKPHLHTSSAKPRTMA